MERKIEGVFYKIVMFLSRMLYRVVYAHTNEFADELQSFQGPAIIAPNHVSYLDPLLVASSWKERDLYFFARSELFDSRLFGLILRGLHVFPVVKGKELPTLRKALALLKEGKKVVLFPEGTRASKGTLGPLQGGVAFLSKLANCPIIPCYISGTYEAWPRERRLPRLGGVKTVCRFDKPLWPNDEGGKPLPKEVITQQLRKRLSLLQGRG